MQEEELTSGNDYEIPIGKYKGQDICKVYEEDQSYFEWLWDNVNLDSYPKFAKILENMIEYGTPF